MLIQLDLFKTEEESIYDELMIAVDKIDKSTGKVRRSLYARNNELEKLIRDLSCRLEIIERNICRGK